MCSSLTLTVHDFVSAPASQTFVERLFSASGMLLLTAGRHNKIGLDVSLKMCAWLEVNHANSLISITDWLD